MLCLGFGKISLSIYSLRIGWRSANMLQRNNLGSKSSSHLMLTYEILVVNLAYNDSSTSSRYLTCLAHVKKLPLSVFGHFGTEQGSAIYRFDEMFALFKQ